MNNRILMLLLAVLTLAACSSRPQFHNMSAEALHAYNADRPYAEQVSCQQLQGLSYIRRVRCKTNQQWAETNAVASMKLNVLDYSGAVYHNAGY